MGGSAEFLLDDTVKSISLADMSPQERPSRRPLAAVARFFARTVHLIKVGLMVWGVISLGAAVAIAAFHIGRSSHSHSVIVATAATPPAPAAPASTATAAERLAALIEAPLPSTMTAPPFSRKPPLLPSAAPRMPAASASVVPPTATPVASEPALILAARLPRPRPDDPIITGSVAPAARERGWMPRPRRAGLDPCTALKNLGAPYLFGNRCGPYTRVYPAPPRAFDRVTMHPAPPVNAYAPRPYQPPVYPD